MSEPQGLSAPPKKDIWDIFKAISIAAIVPLVAWFGHQVNVTVKERDAQIKMLELAVGVLGQDPGKNENKEIPGLRKWAMDVIGKYSGVELPAGARQALEIQALDLSVVRTDNALEALGRAIDEKRLRMRRQESIGEIVDAVIDADGDLWPYLLSRTIARAEFPSRIATFLEGAKDRDDLAERLQHLNGSIIGALNSHTIRDGFPEEE